MAARIDHRSYKEQGIDLIPTIHEGYEVRAMEKKGIKTVIGELNRAIRQFNQMFISLKESIQWMKTAYEEMKDELDRRQNPTLLESLQDYYDKKTQTIAPKFLCGDETEREESLQLTRVCKIHQLSSDP